MIRPYKFHISCHEMLHYHVMNFFDKIEFETGEFDDALFGADFLVIVKRHPKILKERLKTIYKVLKTWNQDRRSALCQLIRDSNDIELICRGDYQPPIIDKNEKGVFKQLRSVFLDLYNQVLDGKGFKDKYKASLRDHFDAFSKLNISITLCPICGIGELKKHEDKSRDQYDHYLPKALYPFSAVNFENLVPCCKECNSFDAKGEQDTIEVSSNRFFFPYDQDHRGINLEVTLKEDDVDIANTEWALNFSNPDGKMEEIQSWRDLYKIDDRYLGHIKGRIEKWYKCYYAVISNSHFAHLDAETRKSTAMMLLEIDEELGLDYIRRPALEAFLDGSTLAQAELEARAYS